MYLQVVALGYKTDQTVFILLYDKSSWQFCGFIRN